MDVVVLFVDQGFVVQCFGVVVVLEFGMYVLVQVFGQCFGEVVGEGFQQDCVVVVMFGFEVCDVGVDVDVCGDCECVDLVLFFVVGWCNEIGQVEIWVFGWFVYLLVQEVQGGFVLCVLYVDIVVDVVGWLQVEYGFGCQLFFVDDVFEYCMGIFVQFVGLGVDDFVGEDGWEFVGQFLGLEEWCLVDVVDQFGQGIVVEYVQVGLIWCWWSVVVLVVLEFLFVCMFQCDQLFGVVLVVVVCVDFGIVGFVGGNEGFVQIM